MKRDLTCIIRMVPFPSHREYHITIPDQPLSRGMLKDFFSKLKRNGIEVMKISLVGESGKLRKLSSATIVYPTDIIGNSASQKGNINSSVYLFAVQGDNLTCRYLSLQKKVIGSYLESADYRHLFLCNLRISQSKNKQDFLSEAKSVYTTCDRIVSRRGFVVTDIYRYWNFLSDIGITYRQFNIVRDEYFLKHAITNYPAATGIEANLPEGARFQLGCYAIQSKNPDHFSCRPISSDMQSDPSTYGPKFSRAFLLDFCKDQIKQLYISGTSSINAKGKSILQNNPKRNVKYVMDSVTHLLSKYDMTEKHIVMAVVYSKNQLVYQYFKQLYDSKKWTFPYTHSFTIICRENLSFEIELIAASKVERIAVFR